MTTTASGAQFSTDPLLKDEKNWNLLLTAYTEMWRHQMRYSKDHGKGTLLIDSFSGAATAAGITVVVASCPHFAANMFSRLNYLPDDALVCHPAATLALARPPHASEGRPTHRCEARRDHAFMGEG